MIEANETLVLIYYNHYYHYPYLSQIIKILLKYSFSSYIDKGSIDSDSGNGKGIISYLSMCSENTRHDFLDTLYKDRDKYMDEKDNIEKQYKGNILAIENLATVQVEQPSIQSTQMVAWVTFKADWQPQGLFRQKT